MKNRRNLILFFILSMLVSVQSHAQGTRTITVGGDRGNPPFEYLDEAGKAAGFTVDLVRRITETVGLDATFELTSPAEASSKLERGGIDVLAGVFASPAGGRSTALSMPYFSMNYIVFTPGATTIHGAADIQGKRITVRRGDIGYEYLNSRGIGATLVVVDDTRDLFSAVLQGDADCAVVSVLQGSYLARDRAFSSFRPVGTPLFRADYRMAVREVDRDLLAMLDEGLSTIRLNGDYEAIYDRWFGSSGSAVSGNRILGIMEAVAVVAMTMAGLAVLWATAMRTRKKQLEAALSMESRRNVEAQDRLHVALTESEVARREAREAERDKSAFITSVSHELRTPLHGMLGATELLAKTRLDGEQADTLSMIRGSAEQLNGVLSDLLDELGGRGRIEAGLPAVSAWKPSPGQDNEALPEPAWPAADIPDGKRPGKAIVAEDEAINRLYLKRVLEAAGVEVRQAIDGKSALDAASDGPWSFILMDVSMPRMDGLEATRLIRAQEAERGAAHIPIIALTAHSSAEDREACARAGMDGFLSKPFSEQVLWAEVDRTIATLAGASFR